MLFPFDDSTPWLWLNQLTWLRPPWLLGRKESRLTCSVVLGKLHTFSFSAQTSILVSVCVSYCFLVPASYRSLSFMYIARNTILFNSVWRINYSFSLVCHQRYRAEAESNPGPPLGKQYLRNSKLKTLWTLGSPRPCVTVGCLPTTGLVFLTVASFSLHGHSSWESWNCCCFPWSR